MTKSKQLAAMAEPIAKMVGSYTGSAPAIQPAFEPKHEPIDALDTHMGIVRYLGLTPACSLAVIKIGEAHLQTGAERRGSLAYAIRALQDDIAHLDRQAVA